MQMKWLFVSVQLCMKRGGVLKIIKKMLKIPKKIHIHLKFIKTI